MFDMLLCVTTWQKLVSLCPFSSERSTVYMYKYWFAQNIYLLSIDTWLIQLQVHTVWIKNCCKVSWHADWHKIGRRYSLLSQIKSFSHLSLFRNTIYLRNRKVILLRPNTLNMIVHVARWNIILSWVLLWATYLQPSKCWHDIIVSFVSSENRVQQVSVRTVMQLNTVLTRGRSHTL